MQAVSVQAISQKRLQSSHNKLEGIQYNVSDDALFILNAARLMKVRVIDILHLKGIEEDSLIYGEIIEKVETVFPFLNMSDI